MRFHLSLPLCAVALFCLAALPACYPEPGQLTVVRGTVTSATTGKSLPGVLMGIESYHVGIANTTGYRFTGNSVRTDAQGNYELHFYNEKRLSYSVVFEPYYSIYNTPRPSRYLVDPSKGSGEVQLTIGKTNAVDFRPEELRTVAVRIRNRNTGYQRLYFNYQILHGNNLDTLAYLNYYYPSPYATQFTYRKLTAAGVVVKDTVVNMVVQNPASLPPDTLRATLTFVR